MNAAPSPHADPIRVPGFVEIPEIPAGRPLGRRLRAELEARLGFPLGTVRVHDGAWAAAAACVVGARAFALGRHVVFAADAFAPETPEGRLLLLHELAHARQQDWAEIGPGTYPLGPDDAWEAEAEAFSRAACRPGRPAAPRLREAPTVRRALTIKRATAKMTTTKDGAAAAVRLGTAVALFHCTKNVNLKSADLDAPPQTLPTSGGAVVFKAEVLFSGDVKTPADHNDLIAKWRFGFLQTSSTVFEDLTYGGRAESEGSMRVDKLLGYVPNPCLDSNEKSADMPFLDSEKFSVVKTGVPGAEFKVSIQSSDNPTMGIDYQLVNRETNAPNFLARARRDEKFTTTFTAIMPDETMLFLAHIEWRLTWDVDFRWTTGVDLPTSVPRALKLVADEKGKPGGPPDEKAQAVILDPKGPVANDLDAKTQKAALEDRKQPFMMQAKKRTAEIPADFFQ